MLRQQTGQTPDAPYEWGPAVGVMRTCNLCRTEQDPKKIRPLQVIIAQVLGELECHPAILQGCDAFDVLLRTTGSDHLPATCPVT